MKYKLTSEAFIICNSSGVYIPIDPANNEYQKYIQWVSEGNTPDPVDPPAPEEIAAAVAQQAAQDAKAAVKADNTTQYLISHTPLEIKTWVQGKLPSLPANEAAFIARLADAIGALYRGI